MITQTLRKGLLVAIIHVAIVASLGAKLLVDRATRPRVWARATPLDPNLPIRGRYVQLRIQAVADGDLRSGEWQMVPIALSARDGHLVASRATDSTRVTAGVVRRESEPVAVLDEPVAYFIPEHVADPSRRAVGEELWVEVTIPRAGAPRPIRLGVKKDGVLTPLDVQ